MPTTGPIHDAALQDWLNALIATSPFATMRIHIFVNNIVPSDSDTLGMYTECTMTGYVAQSVTGWSAASLTGHVGSTSSAQNTFNFSGSFQPIYGVYYTDSTNTKLYGAVRDPNAPVSINSTVSQYLVTTTVTDQSLV